MAVVVVSIDGVAPRFITPETMPTVISVGQLGGATYRSRTITPSLTLPAHISMLQGVGPDVHGIVDNDAAPGDIAEPPVPSFLHQCRNAGLTTASVSSWLPMEMAIGSGASVFRLLFDDGYNPAVDQTVTDAGISLIAEPHRCDVSFIYLISPDLAGHAHGWGSREYLQALVSADRLLAQVAASMDPADTLIVTTDHGGAGNHHVGGTSDDEETFIVVRSPRVEPGSTWTSASILDIAPTATDAANVEAHPAWRGRSLLDCAIPIDEYLWRSVDDLGRFSYGEQVNMAEHALQTAAGARAEGASDDMVAAALLHDVGHLVDSGSKAGPWGYPGHDQSGARLLHGLLPASVTEPIRLHVEAKRWLVANEPGYGEQLSHPSQVTLRHQGGPFTAEESAAFDNQPFANQALTLRRWDDNGKTPNTTSLDQGSAPDIDAVVYRRLLRRLAARPPVSGNWIRHGCQCGQCRHRDNGQCLGSPEELVGWRCVSVAVDDQANQVTAIVTNGHDEHACVIAADRWPTVGHANQPLRLPTGRTPASTEDPDLEPVAELPRYSISDDDWQNGVCRAVVEHGAVVLTGTGTEPGTVLDVAGDLGFVRTTNYGTLFDVRNEPVPENMAYSTAALGFHTDNPYREPCPTVQLLHCIRPSPSGGHSMLADGYAAARRLRHQDPAAFNILATTPMRFCFKTVHDRAREPGPRQSGVDLQASATIIEATPDREPVAIHLNHRSMETPPWYSTIDEFYQAYLKLWEILDTEDLGHRFPLDAGDILVVDNRRMLHARSGFPASEQRHLQGCYIDIDEVSSRVRIADAADS